MNQQEMLAAIEKFRVAYNDVDIDSLHGLLSDKVKWGHRNRFSGEGRDELLRSIENFARKLPGRRFGEYGRTAVNGSFVFAEQTWHGVPAEDNPAWGWQAGVPVTMETCTLFAFENGQITEFTDCG